MPRELIARLDAITTQAVTLVREVDELSDGHQVSELNAAESLLFAFYADLNTIICNLPTA